MATFSALYIDDVAPAASARVRLRAIRNHTAHHGTVRKSQKALETTLRNREVPSANRHAADDLSFGCRALAAECPHHHGVPPGDATSLERQLSLACRVDLVDNVFVMACRTRADTMRFPDPAGTRSLTIALTLRRAGKRVVIQYPTRAVS